MRQFGGDWTEKKIEIVIKYAKAYLVIMNKYPKFKLLYFDGFAGSGDIFREDKTDIDTIKGAAIRILEIDTPKSFDLYYFVELNEQNKYELETSIKANFPDKKTFVVCGDCNDKLVSMANFLRKHKEYKVLIFIDPFGMSVNWSSIEVLQNLSVDLWILVPTGIGMNRLLKNDGKISESWLQKLEKFLGMDKNDILQYFYKEHKIKTLFGEETHTEKEKNAIDKAATLYSNRLKDVFKYVSEPFELRNSSNSIMYHFFFASNNLSGLKIANDIVNKYS